MDTYVTGAAIKVLREKHKMTQAELAQKLSVSDKAVSKWENGRGLPDITLLEPLSRALHISVPELLCGRTVSNSNRASNLMKSKLYICPVCGNVFFAKGEGLISCCGVSLPALEAEQPDEEHAVRIERIEDEYFVSMPHEMTKEHYVSFFAYSTMDCFELKNLYPEGAPEARFFIKGSGWLYYACNRHGLFRTRLHPSLVETSK